METDSLDMTEAQRGPALSKIKCNIRTAPTLSRQPRLQSKPLIRLLLLAVHIQQVWDLIFLIDFEIAFKC